MSVATRPSASVVVVCWNADAVLERCLEHLLAQDYPDYEIVVVDDGSDDESVRVASAALACGKLTIVRSPINRGCPHARNLGMLHASGDVIAFIDADGFAAPSWLGNVVRAFEHDATIGAVASTVFFADRPLVLNGAGGTMNRQGWAADLSMNVPYERANIPDEALYPMGCGMALRRCAAERVGAFDDRMLNYYDDVDYGVRMWRAGYRVVVAPDAWIDHGYAHGGGDSLAKQLLCEQHRMRVMLKHARARTLARWSLHEALAVWRAPSPRHELKLSALRWNVRHLPSTLASRRRLRGAAPMPRRLMDRSWGENFPTGVPPAATPMPERASDRLDIAHPGHAGQLLYGWFPLERAAGRSFRWAAPEAAVLVRLEAPARRLRLRYAHVPADIGGVSVRVRRLGAHEPLAEVWSTHLRWQYIEHCEEHHPVALSPGDYEVVFGAERGWSDPPLEQRRLGIALTALSFEETYEIDTGGIEMASAGVGGQLANGWFEPERLGERSFRWGGARAEALVRLDASVNSARMTFCLPPGPSGGLSVSALPLHSRRAAWKTRIVASDAHWHEQVFPARLAPGEYVVRFDADSTWTNPGRVHRELTPENRSLGFALSSLRFERAPA